MTKAENVIAYLKQKAEEGFWKDDAFDADEMKIVLSFVGNDWRRLRDVLRFVDAEARAWEQIRVARYINDVTGTHMALSDSVEQNMRKGDA